MNHIVDITQEHTPHAAERHCDVLVVGGSAAGLTAALRTIEVHEKRPRPAGAASAAHHVDDIVLRARRNSD